MYIHIYLVIGFLLQSTNPLQIICNFIKTKSYNITKLNYNTLYTNIGTCKLEIVKKTHTHHHP